MSLSRAPSFSSLIRGLPLGRWGSCSVSREAMAALSWYFIVLFNPPNHSSHLPSMPLSVSSVVRLH